LLLKDSWMKFSTKDCGSGSTAEEAISASRSAYDGVESRSLTSNAGKGLLYGFISTKGENEDSHQARLLPLFMYFRPFAEPFHILTKRTLRIKAADVVVNNRHCVVVSDGLTSAWLDPLRACVPLVIEQYRPSGRCSLRAEIQYAEDDVLYWVPKRYRVNVYNIVHPNKLDVCYELSDIVIKPRVSLSQRDFALIFPLGTNVYDGRDGTRYRVGPDGTKIGIAGGRAGKLRIRSSKSSGRMSSFVWVNGIGLTVLCIGWFYLHRRRQSR
jgi:hypothetical protein